MDWMSKLIEERILKAQRDGVFDDALVEHGLEALRERGAPGCALVGDPGFYGRFGFRHLPGITCTGIPDEYVLCLPFAGPVPCGELTHHPAFSIEPRS